jgi:hypothetical protein
VVHYEPTRSWARKVHHTPGRDRLFKWYFEQLKLSEDRLSFLATDLDRQQAEERMKPQRVTETTVVFRRFSRRRVLSNERGQYEVEATFATASPEPFVRTNPARIEVANTRQVPVR